MFLCIWNLQNSVPGGEKNLPFSDLFLLKKYKPCNKHRSHRAVTLPYLNSITTESLQMFIDFIGKSLWFPAETFFSLSRVVKEKVKGKEKGQGKGKDSSSLWIFLIVLYHVDLNKMCVFCCWITLILSYVLRSLGYENFKMAYKKFEVYTKNF